MHEYIFLYVSSHYFFCVWICSTIIIPERELLLLLCIKSVYAAVPDSRAEKEAKRLGNISRVHETPLNYVING